MTKKKQICNNNNNNNDRKEKRPKKLKETKQTKKREKTRNNNKNKQNKNKQKKILKDFMPIIFSSPRAQPEVVYFLILNESPYFSSCKSKISASNSL